MSTTVLRAVAADAEAGRTDISVLLARHNSTLLLSTAETAPAMGWVVPAQVLGEPRMGGREGGVKRPEEREWRRGEERGDTDHGW